MTLIPSDYPHPRRTLHNAPAAHPALVPPRPNLPPSRPGFSASGCRPHILSRCFVSLSIARTQLDLCSWVTDVVHHRFKCHPDQMTLQYPSENPLVSLIDPRSTSLTLTFDLLTPHPTHAVHVAANQIILHGYRSTKRRRTRTTDSGVARGRRTAVTPASGSMTPASGSTTPASGSTTPASGSTTSRIDVPPPEHRVRDEAHHERRRDIVVAVCVFEG
ncbi:hypothetical protein GGF50DRAFT_121537 [Schizophyllum commune]